MIIIPARLDSTRLPGKALIEIRGLPLVIGVAKQVEHLGELCIATDSIEVKEIAKKFEIDCLLTSPHHRNGTERVAEATRLLKLPDDETIINLQADEFNLDPLLITNIIDYIAHHPQGLDQETLLVSACQPLPPEGLKDPSKVKVVLNHYDKALYFSRSVVPHGEYHCWEHLGVYGFTAKSLSQFCALPRSPLEVIENLEQLRALYYGYNIKMIKTDGKSFSINTTQDLIEVERGQKDGIY
jgi:3-deoxy-manno-octulosonate cytidylyltransferase (CMP-KDO synthetase)